MYQTPELRRFGSLRELTLGGGADRTDPFGPDAAGNDGCIETVDPATGNTVLTCIGMPS